MTPQTGNEPARRSGHRADIFLIIGATPDSGWERVVPLFEQAGCSRPDSGAQERWIAAVRDGKPSALSGAIPLKPDARNTELQAAIRELLKTSPPPVAIVGDPRDLEESAKPGQSELPGTRLVLLHARPEAALVRAMAQGQEPAEVLAQWEAAAERVLQTYRRNRDRVSLVDIDCALNAPAHFLQICRTELGLTPGSGGEVPAAAISEDAAGIHHLIASQMVMQSPKIGELVAELEACSLPIGEPSVPAAIDCMKVYHDQQAREEALETLTRELDEQKQLTSERTTQLEQAQQENELLVLQLHQVQEELESYYLQLQSANEKLKQAEDRQRMADKKIDNQERRLRYMEDSKSWKITAPMRAVMGLFARRPPKAKGGQA